MAGLGRYLKQRSRLWIKEAKSLGIVSVICLLDKELKLYTKLPTDLIVLLSTCWVSSGAHPCS
jgi:hypothetical protein